MVTPSKSAKRVMLRGQVLGQVDIGGCTQVVGDCDITQVVIRSNLGFPVQLEKTGDLSYQATLCEDVPAFRTSVTQEEPLFSSGVKCTISGVPVGAKELESGGITAITLIVGKEHEQVTTEYTITVRRLSVGADQTQCKVTSKPSAMADCGYAPLLEKQRQEAAISKGMAPPATPAP